MLYHRTCVATAATAAVQQNGKEHKRGNSLPIQRGHGNFSSPLSSRIKPDSQQQKEQCRRHERILPHTRDTPRNAGTNPGGAAGRHRHREIHGRPVRHRYARRAAVRPRRRPRTRKRQRTAESRCRHSLQVELSRLAGAYGCAQCRSGSRGNRNRSDCCAVDRYQLRRTHSVVRER